MVPKCHKEIWFNGVVSLASQEPHGQEGSEKAYLYNSVVWSNTLTIRTASERLIDIQCKVLVG